MSKIFRTLYLYCCGFVLLEQLDYKQQGGISCHDGESKGVVRGNHVSTVTVKTNGVIYIKELLFIVLNFILLLHIKKNFFIWYILGNVF
ncbi:MAG: hypothetical protein CM15mP44_5430 [Candidatus Neomarinimicrobiota bacterium]|nr:MAG: hypothetical protein CM15mP44_5430 [Candidatus Neomarinimicrobiota bacterium]